LFNSEFSETRIYLNEELPLFIFVKLYEIKDTTLKVFILDFQDSFTFNLSHYFESLGAEVMVCSDDSLNLSELNDFTHIVLSPGPGLPKEKKHLFLVIQEFRSKKPILGVCLGMQGIAEYVGAELYNLEKVKHGVSEQIVIQKDADLFNGIPEKIQVGLYHSWAVRNMGGTGLRVTATNNDGVIMAFENLDEQLYGVQFHPESIMTEQGKKILRNFLNC
jgi:anthranilate synthase/aminodeoxychorismate synthase-like glutamine amidotransferase